MRITYRCLTAKECKAGARSIAAATVFQIGSLIMGEDHFLYRSLLPALFRLQFLDNLFGAFVIIINCASYSVWKKPTPSRPAGGDNLIFIILRSYVPVNIRAQTNGSNEYWRRKGFKAPLPFEPWNEDIAKTLLTSYLDTEQRYVWLHTIEWRFTEFIEIYVPFC